MTTKLYVGNLSFSTTEDSLRAVFSENGRVVQEVKMPSDRETGRPRGFAFVQMGSAGDAAAAMSALDGKEFEGRTLKVNEAQARVERSGDSRPGGGGGRQWRY